MDKSRGEADDASRFELLADARDVAADAVDVRDATEAVDELGKRFKMRRLMGMKMGSFEKGRTRRRDDGYRGGGGGDPVVGAGAD